MMIAKAGLAAVAVAAFIGLAGTSAQAAPFDMGVIAPKQREIVEIQYRGRRVAPPRKVCRTEVVRRWVRGRPVTERVQRCVTRQ
jgi:hypothetical protein